MAPRQKNATEIEAQTNVLHMLQAIQPKIGQLNDKTTQEALLDSVATKYSLNLTGAQLRSRLVQTVSRHPAREGHGTGLEIFTKPANEVLSQEYLGIVGFKIPKNATPNTKEQETTEQETTEQKAAEQKTAEQTVEPKKKLKLKLARPTATKNAPSTRQAGFPQLRSAQDEANEDHDSSAGGSGAASGTQLKGDGSATRVIEEAPTKQDGTQHNHSQSTASHVEGIKNIVDEPEVSGTVARDTTAPATLVKDDQQKKVDDFQQPAQASGNVNTGSPNRGLPNESAQTEQQRQNVVHAGRLDIIDLQARLEAAEQQKAAVDEENRVLKLQLEETNPGNKRNYSVALGGDENQRVEHIVKRSKRYYNLLRREHTVLLGDEMVELSEDVRYIATSYCDTRGVDFESYAEFLTHPSPELRQLYAQLYLSESGSSWERGQHGERRRSFIALSCLFSAGIYHLVFCGKPLWENESAEDQTFASLTQYLFKTEDYVRETAFDKLKDPDFQNGALTQYAEKLTNQLANILKPHLDRLTAGKPLDKSYDWLDELQVVIRKCLIIKAKLDIWHDGEIEPTWSPIGSKMDPLTTKCQNHNYDLVYEVRIVHWPGLKMKVEGQPDIVVSKDLVGAKRSADQ